MSLQHYDAMQIRQAKLHADPPSTDWFITLANGGIISDGFRRKIDAEIELSMRRDMAEREISEDPAA